MSFVAVVEGEHFFAGGKKKYKGDPASVDALCAGLVEKFGLAPGSFVVTYLDQDVGEFVDLDDWGELVAQPPPFKLVLRSRGDVSVPVAQQTPPTSPLQLEQKTPQAREQQTEAVQRTKLAAAKQVPAKQIPPAKEQTATEQVAGRRAVAAKQVKQGGDTRGDAGSARARTVARLYLSSSDAAMIAVGTLTFYFFGMRMHSVKTAYLIGRTEIEKEAKLMSENAFYYSFFKEVVLAKSLPSALIGLTSNREVEYPDTVNCLQRFNIAQEVAVGVLGRVCRQLPIISSLACSDTDYFPDAKTATETQLDTDPAWLMSFYLTSLFAVYALGMGCFLLLAARLNSPGSGSGSGSGSNAGAYFGAAAAGLLYVSNFYEASRIWYQPPLRENWCIPVLYLQHLHVLPLLSDSPGGGNGGDSDSDSDSGGGSENDDKGGDQDDRQQRQQQQQQQQGQPQLPAFSTEQALLLGSTVALLLVWQVSEYIVAVEATTILLLHHLGYLRTDAAITLLAVFLVAAVLSQSLQLLQLLQLLLAGQLQLLWLLLLWLVGAWGSGSSARSITLQLLLLLGIDSQGLARVPLLLAPHLRPLRARLRQAVAPVHGQRLEALGARLLRLLLLVVVGLAVVSAGGYLRRHAADVAAQMYGAYGGTQTIGSGAQTLGHAGFSVTNATGERGGSEDGSSSNGARSGGASVGVVGVDEVEAGSAAAAWMRGSRELDGYGYAHGSSGGSFGSAAYAADTAAPHVGVGTGMGTGLGSGSRSGGSGSSGGSGDPALLALAAAAMTASDHGHVSKVIHARLCEWSFPLLTSCDTQPQDMHTKFYLDMDAFAPIKREWYARLLRSLLLPLAAVVFVGLSLGVLADVGIIGGATEAAGLRKGGEEGVASGSGGRRRVSAAALYMGALCAVYLLMGALMMRFIVLMVPHLCLLASLVVSFIVDADIIQGYNALRAVMAAHEGVGKSKNKGKGKGKDKDKSKSKSQSKIALTDEAMGKKYMPNEPRVKDGLLLALLLCLLACADWGRLSTELGVGTHPLFLSGYNHSDTGGRGRKGERRSDGRNKAMARLTQWARVTVGARSGSGATGTGTGTAEEVTPVFLGDMVTTSALRASARARVTNHPQYETRRSRARSLLAYQIYGERRDRDIHRLATSLGATHICITTYFCDGPKNSQTELAKAVVDDGRVRMALGGGGGEAFAKSRFCSRAWKYYTGSGSGSAKGKGKSKGKGRGKGKAKRRLFEMVYFNDEHLVLRLLHGPEQQQARPYVSHAREYIKRMNGLRMPLPLPTAHPHTAVTVAAGRAMGVGYDLCRFGRYLLTRPADSWKPQTSSSSWSADRDSNPSLAAAAIYKAAIDAAPDESECRCERAEQLERRQPNEAKRLYAEAMEAEPTNSDCSANFAIFLDEAEDPRADEQYRRTIELMPANPTVIGNYGYWHSLQGDMESAHRLYAQASRMPDITPLHLCSYAVLLLDAKLRPDVAAQTRVAEARAAFKRAQALEPGNRHVLEVAEKYKQVFDAGSGGGAAGGGAAGGEL